MKFLVIFLSCVFGCCAEWGSWGSWGPCSVHCGVFGVERRERVCYGGGCAGKHEEVRGCDKRGVVCTDTKMCSNITNLPNFDVKRSLVNITSILSNATCLGVMIAKTVAVTNKDCVTGPVETLRVQGIQSATVKRVIYHLTPVLSTVPNHLVVVITQHDPFSKNPGFPRRFGPGPLPWALHRERLMTEKGALPRMTYVTHTKFKSFCAFGNTTGQIFREYVTTSTSYCAISGTLKYETCFLAPVNNPTVISGQPLFVAVKDTVFLIGLAKSVHTVGSGVSRYVKVNLIHPLYDGIGCQNDIAGVMSDYENNNQTDGGECDEEKWWQTAPCGLEAPMCIEGRRADDKDDDDEDCGCMSHVGDSYRCHKAGECKCVDKMIRAKCPFIPH